MRRAASLAVIALAAPAAVLANEPLTPPEDDGVWYYEIGGAEPWNPPLQPNLTTLDLSFGSHLSAGYSCGEFDPVTTVRNQLQEVADGADAMVDEMVDAANAAVASLPALVLQRAHPGLYDLMQNTLLRAEETLELATKSCEQIEQELAEGETNPYSDLVTLSKGDEWQMQMGVEDDIVRAEEHVEENAADSGLIWYDGTPGSGGERRGGEGQPPVEPVSDALDAGYQTIMQGAPAGDDTRMEVIWEPEPGNTTIDQIEEWTVGDPDTGEPGVLGDSKLWIGEGEQSESVPGHGIVPQLDSERESVQDDMAELLQAMEDDALTEDHLDDLQAPGVGFTPQLAQALDEMPSQERQLAAGRLAQEISMARTMERALSVRRMLLTGRVEPTIARTGPAQDEIDDALDELDEEIENLMLEIEARRAVVSHTSEHLLQEGQRRRDASRGAIAPTPVPEQRIRDGIPEELDD
ncbi:integrating conjugative element protein [Halorhodospira halophila]|uniref:integrating conjugative element protein n=1 Tax=Halorhodospira halophila TaxID=1053 RepID=UPI001911BBDF|nr:integrating conjugative element protein [Halorhodospira halophila]MBK5944844.1 integrating conjugative element protein [Halorhodospira halophila]